MDPSQHRGSPSRPQPTDDGSNTSDRDDQHQQEARFAERESGSGRQRFLQPPPGRREKPKPSAVAAPAAAAAVATPAVYWDDHDNDASAGPAQYTFYREGTPTPSEHESQREEKGPGGHVPPATKKRAPWILSIGLLIIIGIAVGVGVGLGVGLSKKMQEDTDAAKEPPSSNSSPVPAVDTPAPTDPRGAVSTAPTATETAASQTATDGTAAETSRPEYNSDCPALNNTVYHIPGSTKTFLRLCGVDYSGGGGATDLAHVYTGSMTECMHVCASFDRCTACGWGYLPGDELNHHRCYMKTDLKRAHRAASDWCLAILQ